MLPFVLSVVCFTLVAIGSSGANGFKTAKKSVTYLGESRAFDSVGYVVPKNQHFVSTMVKSTPYCLTVSVPVVELHGIRLKPEIMLLGQNGDKWPVKVAFRSNGRIALV
ncbi:hypothetical protein Pint_28159 [Pistacia integerrima]|uniref:Uncharacterized protein n=1 Tax=Pistacia integerrima TaxID=434235 RepID=A0ACC0YTV4_9ROSI|nr:hypothetical protein Pint_28159 [Pistacia integerrima]